MLAVLATIHNSAPQYKTFHVKKLFLTPCRSQLLCILKFTPCRSLSLSKHYPIPTGLITNSKSMRQKIQWILSCRNQGGGVAKLFEKGFYLQKVKWHLCLVMFGVTSQWYGGGGFGGLTKCRLQPICPIYLQYISKLTKKSTSTIFTPLVFIKKQKSTIYINKMTKSTIFISNIKFLPTNLHLKLVLSLQYTILNGLNSCVQSTIILPF